MTNTKSEAQELAEWFDEASGFKQGTSAPHKWVLRADSELRRLAGVEVELESTKKALALVQQHHATAWNRGHEAGMRASRDTVRQATEAVKRDAWGNTQLTEALLAAEAERDRLRDENLCLRPRVVCQRDELARLNEKCARLSAELAAARGREPLTDGQIVDWFCEEAEYTCGQWQVVIESDNPSFIDAVKEQAMRAHGITSSKEGAGNG